MVWSNWCKIQTHWLVDVHIVPFVKIAGQIIWVTTWYWLCLSSVLHLELIWVGHLPIWRVLRTGIWFSWLRCCVVIYKQDSFCKLTSFMRRSVNESCHWIALIVSKVWWVRFVSQCGSITPCYQGSDNRWETSNTGGWRSHRVPFTCSAILKWSRNCGWHDSK